MRSNASLITPALATGLLALTGVALTACGPLEQDDPAGTDTLASAATAARSLTVTLVSNIPTGPIVDIIGKHFTRMASVTLEIDEAGVFGNLSQTPTLTADANGSFDSLAFLTAPTAACFVTIVAIDDTTHKKSKTVRFNKPGCQPPTFTASLDATSSGPPGLTFSGDHWTPSNGVDVGIDLNGSSLTDDVFPSDNKGHISGSVLRLDSATCGHTIKIGAVDEATGVESKLLSLSVTCH